MKPHRALANLLKETRKYASLESANFGWEHEKLTYNGKEYTVDAFIKERTKLHRDTWILPNIDKAIRIAEGENVADVLPVRY